MIVEGQFLIFVIQAQHSLLFRTRIFDDDDDNASHIIKKEEERRHAKTTATIYNINMAAQVRLPIRAFARGVLGGGITHFSPLRPPPSVEVFLPNMCPLFIPTLYGKTCKIKKGFT